MHFPITLLGFDPLGLAKQKYFLRASFFSEFFFLSVYRNVRFFQFLIFLNRFTQTFKITEYRKKTKAVLHVMNVSPPLRNQAQL